MIGLLSAVTELATIAEVVVSRLYCVVNPGTLTACGPTAFQMIFAETLPKRVIGQVQVLLPSS